MGEKVQKKTTLLPQIQLKMIETNRFHLQKTRVKKKELDMKKGINWIGNAENGGSSWKKFPTIVIY
jgi:hypothetical protein